MNNDIPIVHPKDKPALEAALVEAMGLPKGTTGPSLATKALELWESVAMGQIRKAKGLPETAKVDLPDGTTGRYIRYAFDNAGRLSMGKGHGRRKPRLKSRQADERRLVGTLFSGYIGSIIRATRDAAVVAKEGETPAPTPLNIGEKELKTAQKWAVEKAGVLINAKDKAKARAAGRRQDTSRRINRGTIPGNSDRRSHSRG